MNLLPWILASVRKAGWAPLAVVVLHGVLSRVFGAYVAWPELDLPMHVLGGVVIAYFFATAVRLPEGEVVLGTLHPAGRGLLVLALVSTAAVVWEYREWTTDRLGWSQAQGGLDDTMLDLFLGQVGGLLWLTADVLRRR